jgi:hypothetical protein
LARASELAVDLPVEALPSRTELKSSTSTFLAEALWVGLNVVVSIATGRDIPTAAKAAVGLVKQYIRPLLEITEIIGCMQKAVRLAQGKGVTSEALSDLFDVFTSHCAQLIAKALPGGGTQAAATSFWSRIAVLAALKKAGESLIAGVAGQYQQGFPPVRITVERVSPPPGACPTPQGFVEAMKRTDTYRGQPIQPGDSVVCDGGMAVSLPSLHGQEAFVILIRSGAGWNATDWIGGEFNKDDCATLPPKIHAYLQDNCV